MPFIPHTPEETQAMLSAIGAENMDVLFDEIPETLKVKKLEGIAAGLSEMEAMQLFQGLARRDAEQQCFIGAGAYEHHIPSAVWDITSRGEFLTSYTPYQAEASQGTLQLLYEFQTMMTSLTGLEVSNASLYDGATAVAEAILMAIRQKRRQEEHLILVPEGLSAHYREVLDTLIQWPGVAIEMVPMDSNGRLTTAALDSALVASGKPLTALVIAQPNFFGGLEDVDGLTRWAHAHKGQVIGQVNPMSLALLKAPGDWGDAGADIACGEAQPFGIPLASGGPYLGFLCSTTALVRQMPGRIVGKTTGALGEEGFCLTLQAREQHIRRGKATSNVCTNQGLLVTAATIYMALVGPEGLRKVALACHQRTQFLKQAIEKQGLKVRFSGSFFHEIVISLEADVDKVLALLSRQGIQGGYALSHDYPQLENTLLICATETKTEADCAAYASTLAKIVEAVRVGEQVTC